MPQPVPYYTCLRELGRGAMGVVYQARHNMTGRMVALKLIMPETATTRSAIDRFQREMSVISQIRHPNIVECYEQGMTRGQFWFAMEYVAGTNLEALAKADPGRYPVNQACRLTCQILKGLEEAHKLGFVHRDIKPENILIAQTPEGLTVKISDFGLAKSFRGVGLSGLTFSGEMRGTVPFMPPEQMLDFKTVTPLADLYATAATLYYMLTCAMSMMRPPAAGISSACCWRSRPFRSASDAWTCPRGWPTSFGNAWPASRRSGIPTPRRCETPSSRSAELTLPVVLRRAVRPLAEQAPHVLQDGLRRQELEVVDLALLSVAVEEEDPRGVVERPGRSRLDPHVPVGDHRCDLLRWAGQEVPGSSIGAEEARTGAARRVCRAADRA